MSDYIKIDLYYKRNNIRKSEEVDKIVLDYNQLKGLKSKLRFSLKIIQDHWNALTLSVKLLPKLLSSWMHYKTFGLFPYFWLDVEKFLEAQINSFNIAQWKEVCNSREYLKFLTRIKSDNCLVRNEMILLMNASQTKANQLDKTKREKVLWFLNDDLDSNIQPICLSYLKDQLLLAVVEKRGVSREPIEWLKLQLSLKASIIITQLPVLVCENKEFSYERYIEYQDSQNYAQIQKYCEQLKIMI